MNEELLDLIVLNYNDWQNVFHYIENIREYKIINHILVVDNNSSDDSYSKLKQLEDDKIIVIKTPRNGGYGYGNNFAIRYCYEHFCPEFVIISNPDVEFKEEIVEEMVSFLKKTSDAAIVAPTMKNSNGQVETNCAWRIRSAITMSASCIGKIDRLFRLIHYNFLDGKENGVKQVDAVAGSFFMVRLDLMIQHGMYDEKMFLYCEESLLGIKMKQANLKTFLLLDKYFIHQHGGSINKTITSVYKQYCMVNENRKYLVENYLAKNFICKWFSFFLLDISLYIQKKQLQLRNKN